MEFHCYNITLLHSIKSFCRFRPFYGAPCLRLAGPVDDGDGQEGARGRGRGRARDTRQVSQDRPIAPS